MTQLQLDLFATAARIAPPPPPPVLAAALARFDQLAEEEAIAEAEQAAEARDAGADYIDDGETLDDGEPVEEEPERNYCEERREEKRRMARLDQAEAEAMHADQPPLAAAEAEAEALAAFAALEWIDAGHRNRALFRLRGGTCRFERDQAGGLRIVTQLRRNAELADATTKSAKADAARLWRIDAERVSHVWAITRARPLEAIAADLWQLLDAYDKSKRAGEVRQRPTLWLQVQRLEQEANQGTSFGVRVERRVKRLWKLIRVRARAERRWPMWGVPGRFRFACRGMHIVANTDGLSMEIDRDRHRAGDLSFSSSGYRSFLSHFSGPSEAAQRTPEEWARAILESYIDAKPNDNGGGGLGGKLERWIPWQLQEWARVERERRRRAKGEREAYRAECPAMTPAAERPAFWAKHDAEEAAKQAEREAWMRAQGIDALQLCPDLAPPRQAALL